MDANQIIERLQKKYGMRVTIEENRVKIGQTIMSFEKARQMAA